MWIKFTGIEEQVNEILNARDGIRFKRKDREREFALRQRHLEELDWDMIEYYLICQANPHSDMIIEWARTGREVYRLHYLTTDEGNGEWVEDMFPQWMPHIKYSFNPDGDGNGK